MDTASKMLSNVDLQAMALSHFQTVHVLLRASKRAGTRSDVMLFMEFVLLSAVVQVL